MLQLKCRLIYFLTFGSLKFCELERVLFFWVELGRRVLCYMLSGVTQEVCYDQGAKTDGVWTELL